MLYKMCDKGIILIRVLAKGTSFKIFVCVAGKGEERRELGGGGEDNRLQCASKKITKKISNLDKQE